MFRSIFLVLAALVGTTNAQVGVLGGANCGDSGVIIPAGGSLAFDIGDTFTFNFFGLSEEWFSITVVNSCEITLGVSTCQAILGSDTKIEVFDSCGGSALGSAEANCVDSSDQFTGANLNVVNSIDTPGTKTYFIRVTSPSGAFLPGGVAIAGGITGRRFGACGDPHFTRWTMKERDSFHGECDLVLLQKDNIEEDLDLDVHIRTTIEHSFSYISGVAVKAGETVMEFEHDAMFINGEKQDDQSSLLELGNGNKVTKISGAEAGNRPRYFRVSILDKIFLDVYSTKNFMGVKIAQSDALDGSVGMLGDHATGDMVGRDGRILENFEEFGFEWQVAPTDPIIFKAAREPQLPYERCRMPSTTASAERRRKLRGQDRKLYEQAVDICTKNHIPANVQSCIDDVVFTGELDLAYEV